MLDIWNALKSAQKPILIYGTGNGADKIIDELEKNNIAINGVFASDGFVRERYFHNMKVLSLYQAEEIFDDFIVLFAFGSNRPEVINNIKEISKKHEILAPDVPVCDGDIFNLSFAKKHSDELRKVYDLLNDNLSKKVFEETTLFKLDGKIDRLFSCESDPDETFSNILRLNDFMKRFIANEPYESCLVPNHVSYLMQVKKGLYDLKEARRLAYEVDQENKRLKEEN